MLKAILPPRGCDQHGCGHFNAPRGSRRHKGFDLACYPETEICSLTSGKVTKIGYPYKPSSENGHTRYVEVTNQDGLRFRYFYVQPLVEVGDYVALDAVVGKVQKHTAVDRGMTSHVHVEIKDREGKFLDPTPFVQA